MAATYDSSSVYSLDSFIGSQPYTWSASHTSATGSDTGLIVIATIEDGGDKFDGCWYNGVSLTQLAVHTATAQSVAVYYLANPASGSNTLEISYTANRLGGALAINVNDCLQSGAMLDTLATASSGFGDTTETVSSIASTSGELVIMASALRDLTSDPSVTYGTGQTGTAEAVVANSQTWLAGSYKTSGSASESMTHSWTGGSRGPHVAFTVQPAAGGGVPGVFTLVGGAGLVGSAGLVGGTGLVG